MHKALLALAAALIAAPSSAQTLIANVNGIQVGADGKLERFGSLLIGRDGRVVSVIKARTPKVKKLDRTIDGGGRTLLPGLIDAHGHVLDSPGQGLGLGLTMLRLDLTGSASLQEMLDRLRTFAAANPDDPWIVGRGWNQELWPDKRFPTASDLDRIVSDRPVVLDRVDGHAIIANSAALRAAGIDAATADPPGGKIERDSSGKPTGLLLDAASEIVGRKLPPPSPAQYDEALARAQQALLAFGVTAVADAGTSPDGWNAFQRAAQGGRLKLRVMSYALGIDQLPAMAPGGPTQWLHGDRLRLGGVKFYTDGALGSRGAFLKRPYADKPDTRGLQFMTEDKFREQAGKAAAQGYQLATHAIGDAAVAQVIAAYEELARLHPGDRRWRIEHFQVADPADIPRLAPAGIIASMQPTHQTSDRLMAEKRLGPDRLAGAYAWQSVLRSGARIAFGSDFPVESPNPFPGLAAAVSRQDMNGEPPGGWLPHERVSFAQALSGFTRDAAYAGFAEQRFGSLEPGKWADFILVDRDVSTAAPLDLGRTQVLETWIAGEKVWEAASASGERG